MAGVNSVFSKNDQMGLMATWNELTQVDEEATSSVGVLIYYGRNL